MKLYDINVGLDAFLVVADSYEEALDFIRVEFDAYNPLEDYYCITYTEMNIDKPGIIYDAQGI